MKLEKSSPEFADALGQAIVALSYSMCGVDLEASVPVEGVVQGFNKLAPEYIRVTEGRDGPGPEQMKKYSSCADQLHALLERVGVRLPNVVNRGKNHVYGAAQMIKLEKPNCPFAKTPPSDPTYRPPIGSLCLIWSTGFDAHALVILGAGSDDKHIRTGNYGAGGMSEFISPGANVADSPCVWDDKRKALLIGKSKRALHSVIEPASIVPYIDAQIDLSGARVTDDLIQALGAKW
jgi:hypothetical protein